jgi:DNA-binding SARP family transcriptional activator
VVTRAEEVIVRRSTDPRPSEAELPLGRRPEVVRVELLGGFRVTVGSRVVGEDAWRLRKAAALVKLLALEPNHRLHKEQAMDLLWPHLGARAAANNLHRTLYAARRVLEPRLPAADSRHLRLHGEQLELCPGGSLWVDVGVFEEAAAKARRLRDPAAYRAAADLYAGELLPADRYEAWAEDRREGLRQQYISLLLEIARLQEDDGQAIEALSKVVAEEPTHEGAHAGLMRLYARGGRREEALEQYGRLRRALGREFAGEPGAASRRLRDEILAGDNLPPRQPEGRGTRRPGDGRRDNLPVTRTSFVGRDSELVGRRPRRRSLSRSTRGRREWSIRGMRHPDRRTYDVFVASQGRCAAPGSDTEQGRRLRRSGSRLPGGAPELRGGREEQIGQDAVAIQRKLRKGATA